MSTHEAFPKVQQTLVTIVQDAGLANRAELEQFTSVGAPEWYAKSLAIALAKASGAEANVKSINAQGDVSVITAQPGDVVNDELRRAGLGVCISL